MWKWIVGIFALLVVICGGGGAFLATSEKAKEWIKIFKPAEKIDEVRVEPAEIGDLVRMVNAPGSIEPETVVKISAEVSAQILELPYEEGDTVRKGDLLVVLDDEQVQARLDAAVASLESERARREGAAASRDEALAEFGRIKELYESGDYSKSEYDSAKARYESAEASLKMADHAITRAEANVTQARKDLANTKIIAPMSGAITKIHTEVGETVLGTATNVGSVIMEIADLSQMLMRAQIDETNIGPVGAGQRAEIALNAYPDKVYAGTVRRVSLQRELARDGTGYVEGEIVLELPEGERLYTGLTANADIAVETLTGVLKVPSQAVLDRRVEQIPEEIRNDNPDVDLKKTFTQVVYREIDGKAVVTPVTTGPSDLTHTVIRSGLQPGDEVITGPYKILATLEHDHKVKRMGVEADKAAGEEGGEADGGDDGGQEDPGEAGAEAVAGSGSGGEGGG